MNTLKYIIVVLIGFNTTISFSQKNNFTVSTPNVNVLYKGFDNIIEIGFVKKKTKYTVDCIGCDTLFKVKNNDNLYVIKLGLDSLPEIEIRINNKKGKLLQTVIYKTICVPNPSVKLGKYNGFDRIDSLTSETKLTIKKNIDFSIWFSIRNWKITVNDKVFTGQRNQLSNEVLNFMKEAKKGVILVELMYIDPVLRRKDAIIKEIFILNL